MTNNQSAKEKDTTGQSENLVKKISVFGAKLSNALLVPDMPLTVRNNCQSGTWTIGDTDYPGELKMTIIKFSKFFGNLGQTQNTVWGQLWFVAESGSLPPGTVMVTYIKSRSLNEFNALVTTIQAKGVEPATGIFTAKFLKQTGQKPDSNGVTKPVNYYSLGWSWEGPSNPNEPSPNQKTLDQAIVALDDPLNLSRMTDFEGTEFMMCLDNLAPHEVSQLIGRFGGGGSSEGPVRVYVDQSSLPSAEPLKQLHGAVSV